MAEQHENQRPVLKWLASQTEVLGRLSQGCLGRGEFKECFREWPTASVGFRVWGTYGEGRQAVHQGVGKGRVTRWRHTKAKCWAGPLRVFPHGHLRSASGSQLYR